MCAILACSQYPSWLNNFGSTPYLSSALNSQQATKHNITQTGYTHCSGCNFFTIHYQDWRSQLVNLQCGPKVENQLSRIHCTIMSSDLHDHCHNHSSCGIWFGVDTYHMNQFICLCRLENMIGIWFDLMGFRRPMMKGRNAGILKSIACSSQSSFSHQRHFYCKDKGNPIKWGDECVADSASGSQILLLMAKLKAKRVFC